MRVQVYDHDSGIETFRSIADLADCLPDPIERARARRCLLECGSYWCGGSARRERRAE
jgi:hypothetical protein